MLSGILSKEDCSKCKICCEFDDSDLWETPVIYEDGMKSILEINPAQEFLEKDFGGGKLRLLKLHKQDDSLYPCTMLDRTKGCMLGKNNKPFDCKIWPLRVMKKGKKTVIALSPVCPVIAEKPIADVKAVAEDLADEIFAQAKLHPEIVKDYIDCYKILVEE